MFVNFVKVIDIVRVDVFEYEIEDGTTVEERGYIKDEDKSENVVGACKFG